MRSWVKAALEQRIQRKARWNVRWSSWSSQQLPGLPTVFLAFYIATHYSLSTFVCFGSPRSVLPSRKLLRKGLLSLHVAVLHKYFAGSYALFCTMNTLGKHKGLENCLVWLILANLAAESLVIYAIFAKNDAYPQNACRVDAGYFSSRHTACFSRVIF